MKVPVRPIVVTCVLGLTAAIPPLAARQDPQPPIKSGIELIMVDAQVVDRKGLPVAGLKAPQFQVTIDGKRRNVVSAELLESATAAPKDGTPPEPAAAANRARGAGSPGNIYILAVDQGSFRPINAASVIQAAREFLKQAHPSDHIGVVSFPQPGIRIDPTRDRAEVEAALPKLVGFSALKNSQRFRYTLSDAIDVAARERAVLDAVVKANCPEGDLICASAVEAEMVDTVSLLELQAARSLHGLREVIGAVAGIPGRKTMVVLSAGIPSGDRTGGRLYMRSDAVQAGQEAAAAGILLYTLQLTTRWLDAFSPDAPSAAQTAMRESGVYGKALDYFNGTAGGTYFEVNTGAETAITRVMREMSAYYLLGVEVEAADRDGRSHRIQVKVDSRGSSLRHRPSVTMPKAQ